MIFLHIMLRVLDLEKSLTFFSILAFEEVSRFEQPMGRFTLVYLRNASSNIEIELTHNWDQTTEYTNGNNFGHIAVGVDDIYAACEALANTGATVARPPRDGAMAFIKSPDGISIELLQKGAAKQPLEPWASMQNQGSW